MSYEKPELTLMASAVEAIKGDKDGFNSDSPTLVSIAAYQADE